MNNLKPGPGSIPVAIGLGLMGCSITTCLLMAGHLVIAITRIPADLETARPRISAHLEKSKQEGLTNV